LSVIAVTEAGLTEAGEIREPSVAVADGECNPRRLLWHCRRGMKELDVLLERFALEALPSALAEERNAFAELLELPDPALAGYLLGGEAPPQAHLARLVRRIRGT
jgi:antitoxin CptB